MADMDKPELREPVAQEAKLVGDDAVNEQTFKVEPEVVMETVPAQVAQPRESDDGSVNVHETSVRLDEVITDPSDPRAVQIPDAGRGSLDLPIHGLASPTVEEVFAQHAAESEDVSDEERAEARSEGERTGDGSGE